MITEFKIERVEVPVRVPCVSAKDIPVKPTIATVNIKTADTRQLAAAISAYVVELSQYVARAEIIFMRCAAAPVAPK